jgi:hypothetical protein
VTGPTPPLSDLIADGQLLSELPDPVVTRINELLTTVLDVAGSLGTVFAVGWIIWGAPWRQALAVAVAGLLVVAFSNLAQRRAAPKPPPPIEVDETIPLPGASHPGNVHIMGR